MRTWALLAVSVLAAGLGLGVAAVEPGDEWSTDGPVRAMSLRAAPGAPLAAIVPAEAGRVLAGRLGNPHENTRAGLLTAFLFGALLLPALRPAFDPARAGPQLRWLSPGRSPAAGRAPPRSRLV